jgi:hypothetical protein
MAQMKQREEDSLIVEFPWLYLECSIDAIILMMEIATAS